MLQELQNLRYIHLRESFERAFEASFNDEMTKELSKDETTRELVSLRIKEIFEHVIHSDREDLLAKMIQQYSETKEALGRLETHLVIEEQNRLKMEEYIQFQEAKLNDLSKEMMAIQSRVEESEEIKKASISEREGALQMANEAIGDSPLQSHIENLEAEIEEKRQRILRIERELAETFEELEKEKASRKSGEESQKELWDNLSSIKREKEKLQEEFREMAALNEATKHEMEVFAEKLQEKERTLDLLRDELDTQKQEEEEKAAEAQRESSEQIELLESKIKKMNEKEAEEKTKQKNKMEKHEEALRKAKEEVEKLQENLEMVQVRHGKELARIQKENIEEIEAAVHLAKSEAEKEKNEEIKRQKKQFEENLKELHEQKQKELRHYQAKSREKESQVIEAYEEKLKGFVPLEIHDSIIREKDEVIRILKEQLEVGEKAIKEYYGNMMKGAEQKMGQMRQELGSNCSELLRENEQLKEALRKAMGEVHELGDLVNEERGSNKRMRRSLEETNARLDLALRDFEKKSNEAEEMKERMFASERKMGEMEVSQSEKCMEIEELTQKIEGTLAESEILEGELKEMKNLVSEYRNEILPNWESTNMDLRKSNELLNSKLKDICDEFSRVESENKELGESLAETMSKEKKLRGSLEMVESELSQVVFEKESLILRINDYSVSSSLLGKEVENLKEKLEKSENEKKQISKESQKEKEAQKRKRKRTGEELQRILKEVVTIKKEMESLKKLKDLEDKGFSRNRKEKSKEAIQEVLSLFRNSLASLKETMTERIHFGQRLPSPWRGRPDASFTKRSIHGQGQNEQRSEGNVQVSPMALSKNPVGLSRVDSQKALLLSENVIQSPSG